MRIRSIGYVLAVVVAANLCFGQATSKRANVRRSEAVLKHVPNTEVVSDDSDNPESHLSKPFVVAAMRSVSTLREWQSHLSFVILNGYPPSLVWIATDRERAADALGLAAVAASTEADREVLQQLTAEFGSIESWTAGGLDAYKNLRAASYYMSPAALQNDEKFQHSAQCTQALMTVLAKQDVVEQPLCR